MWILQPVQVLKNPTFRKMLNITSQATHGIRLPSPRQSRANIIKMFKQQLCLLWDCLNVYIFLVCYSSFTDTCSLIRAPLWVAKSSRHAMHGRLATPMLTLQSPVTGLKNKHLESGLLNKRYSDLFRWTWLTTVCNLGKHFTRCATISRSCIRQVLIF